MTAPAVVVSLESGIGGTYGDRGNALVLAERLRRRGIPCDIVEWTAADGAIPPNGDLYVLGGAEDQAQLRLVEALRIGRLDQVVDRGRHVFAVCAGLQVLGTTFAIKGNDSVPALDLIDVASGRLAARALGEVVADLSAQDGPLPLITGFTNHAGATRLGPQARPLARIRAGIGNTGRGEGDEEGVVQGTIVGTYLHGPVLARNPALADWLWRRALGYELAPLAAGFAEQLHDERVESALEGTRRRTPHRDASAPPD